MEDRYIYKELSHKIVGAAFEVYNTVGFGMPEKYIQAAYAEELKAQGLKELDSSVIGEATIGGSLSLDPRLQFASQKTKVWSDSEVSDIDILELKRTDIILSTVLKIKSAS
jgi:hypothetical protein